MFEQKISKCTLCGTPYRANGMNVCSSCYQFNRANTKSVDTREYKEYSRPVKRHYRVVL